MVIDFDTNEAYKIFNEWKKRDGLIFVAQSDYLIEFIKRNR